ncbi:MAG: hypothetical protein V4636_18125 [Pseudomonadota bacterium]
MRTLLLAVMIVLLPIRGWLGDAMAVEMARHAMPAVAAAMSEAAESAAANAHCHEAMVAGDDMSGMKGMSMDHAIGHATAHDAADGHDAPPHDADIGHQGCGTCIVCQVCHTVALGGLPATAISHEAPQARPAFRATRFASTEPAPGLKPPIS